jgi:hypothetical protein
MSLLSIARDVAIEVGLSQPVSAVDNSQNAIDLTYAIYRAGHLTAQEHDWSRLQVAGEITGDGVTAAWPLPSDFDRFSGKQRLMRQGQSLYSYSPLLTPADVTYYRAVAITGMTYRLYRRGLNLVFDPVIITGQKVFFEYQSKSWVLPQSGMAKDRPNLDNDNFLIDEVLLTMGAVWQWRKMKKLDFEAEQQEWLRLLNLRASTEVSDDPIGNPMDFDDLCGPSTPDQIG